jgi:protein-L-isoaspartate O-methyltransferase
MTAAPSLFTGKAAAYAKYRADYPALVVHAAMDSVQLAEPDVVADIGAGTGMLSRWFLERGNRVYGVEPDEGMRLAARESLSRFGAAHSSVSGSAEPATRGRFISRVGSPMRLIASLMACSLIK